MLARFKLCSRLQACIHYKYKGVSDIKPTVLEMCHKEVGTQILNTILLQSCCVQFTLLWSLILDIVQQMDSITNNKIQQAQLYQVVGVISLNFSLHVLDSPRLGSPCDCYKE